MIQIPIISKLHIYIIQLDTKVTSLSNKGQPLASSHSEVSSCRPYGRKDLLMFSEMHLHLV